MRSGLVFEVADLESLRRKFETEGQPRRLYTYANVEFEAASMAKLEWDNGILFFSELTGAIVNTTSARVGQISIGAAVRGSACVRQNTESIALIPGDSLLYLPGDMAIQVLDNSSQFTLRMPVSQEVLFRLACRPARVRASIARRIPHDVSTDLISLFQFLSAEYDRLEGVSPSSQIDALGHAIVERVTWYLGNLIEPHASSPAGLLEVCLRASEHIEHNLSVVSSTQELAAAASCSVRTLHRAFEAIGDTTPADFHTRARLNYGRSLLFSSLDPIASLAQIASDCGFKSARSFKHAYENEFGPSPEGEILQYKQILRELGG